MINLVKSNFARNYNPKNQNDEGGATYEIKQMLNSRKLSDQYKAVNLLLETLTGYPDESVNRTKVCDYFLNSDICVFLANPLSNNDWNVQRDVIKCLKILSATRTFFVGNHAAIVTTSILRLLNHNVKNNKNDSAVDFCLYFLTDMIAGLSQVDQPPLISKGTVLNADQLFEFLLILPEHMAGNSNTNLITCLLLDGIVSMQTDKMDLNYKSVDLLSQVIKIWMPLFCNTMNDLANSIDVQNSVDSFYGILCHSGISCMRLCKYMREYDPNRNFVQKVITVEEDILRLRTCTETICKALFTTIKHLIEYTQENVDSIENENFESFLKFMFVSITEKANSNFQSKLLEIVVSHGFLEILPSAYGKRKNSAIAKLSYLNLSELLCLLSKQYLNIDDYPYGIQGFSRELQRGLKEVCHSPNGVKPKDMMKNGNYNGIIVYLYFYCLSIHNPQEVTSMYLPYLISFINHFPTNAGLPAYLVKCIWLLFSMASMSCSEYSSIEEKVQFFRALSGFVHLIRNDATEHYTHHPSILLWAFSFSRIPKDVKVATLSSWLSKEDTLPDALISESETRYLLVEILDKTKEKIIIVNSGNILKHCLENFLEGEDLDALSSSIWELLSGIYSQFLIDGDAAVLKLKCITELATKVMPFKVESDIYRKVAFLIIHVLCKFKTYTELNDEYVDVVTTTLILSIQIMHIANEDSDSTVLMSFANRQELLLKVLTAVIADDPKLSCTALEFLSTFVYFHATIQPYNKSVIRINIKNFMAFISHDEEKSKSVLRFVYTLLTSSSPYSIFSITSAVSDKDTVCVLKSVMFRLQMFCCQKNREQSAIGWKTLNCLLNYTRRLQGDDTSIISLALQPWTNTLIQFQLQQSPYCAEFLLFLKTWLIILKVLLKDKICFEVTDSNLSLLKCNAYFTTLSLLQTSLASTDSITMLPLLREEDRMKIWREKELHGRFYQVLNNINTNYKASVKWLQHSDIYGETEGFLLAIQVQVVATRNYKKYIMKDNTVDICRACGVNGETLRHVTSGCPCLATTEYLYRHNTVAKIVHQQLALDRGLISGWPVPYFKYIPEAVLENDRFKMYWDHPILTDRMVGANRPDIVIIDKNNKKAFFVDITIPYDENMSKAENDKIAKYLDLSFEFSQIWRMDRPSIIPIVISTNGIIPKTLKAHLENLGLNVWLENYMQKAVMLANARIVRKFLSM